MKKIMILVCLIFSLLQIGLADPIDTIQFTVVAPSGLSLRNDIGLNSKKIDIIPFGSTIIVNGYFQEIDKKDRRATIDGRPGYWLKTQFKNKEGYVFSGYLKRGSLYLPSSNINKDYRILVPGNRCDAINYDKDLNWYGFKYDTKTQQSKLYPIKVKLDYSFDSSVLDMSYAEIGDFVQVKTNKTQSFLFYIGTRNSILTTKIDLEKGWFPDIQIPNYNNVGRFIYPYQRLEIARINNRPYYITGHEIARGQEENANVNRSYKLYLSTNTYGIELTRKDTVDITRLLHDYDYSSYYLPFRGVKLIWQGDINADGFPDLIFHTPYTAEGCGGSIFYHLMVSEKQGDKFVLKKAAEDIVNSCHGC